MVQISKVMRKVVIIDPSISVRQASKIMSKKKIPNLIIVKDGKVKGIITERDVLGNLVSLDEKVSKIMSRKIISVGSEEDILEAGRIMADNKIKRLPVMRDGKLVGAISFIDVLRKAGSGSSEGEFFFN